MARIICHCCPVFLFVIIINEERIFRKFIPNNHGAAKGQASACRPKYIENPVPALKAAVKKFLSLVRRKQKLGNLAKNVRIGPDLRQKNPENPIFTPGAWIKMEKPAFSEMGRKKIKKIFLFFILHNYLE